MAFSDDYYLLTEGGNGCEGVNVYLYPNTSAVDEWIWEYGKNEEITNALDQVCTELLNDSAIEYYKVYRYGGTNDYPDLTDSDKNTYRGNFKSYLEDDISADYYPDRAGVHFGVADGFDDGGGWRAGSSATESAFMMAHGAVLGTASGNADRIKSFGIQEPLHGYCSYDVAVDYGYVQSGSSTHEHDLGKIYSNGAVSPMLTTWTTCGIRNDHSTHGFCSNSNSCDDTHSQSITWCTSNVVNYTRDEAYPDGISC